ncbi:hypothetical protein K469DRAFT_148412 [Zopfia rhizophila CBS 207.26]|uniref:Uncharacterized protein n=1 Tax=Zopfia rhizophila CBS 207.26 TaxID=1314779 RepID=A0A6A6E7V3_9PEZI|nr:hypothetical protein K469DRAFT_148412 [Zopfia rhizophila CBS 207.26]
MPRLSMHPYPSRLEKHGRVSLCLQFIVSSGPPSPIPQQDLDDKIEVVRTITNHPTNKATQDSIPKTCRVNSSNLITYDPRPPSKRKAKRKHRWKDVWKGVYLYVKSRYCNLRKKEPSDGDDDDDWVRTISVAFVVDGEEILRHGRAKFDTGNPKNLISPAFAAKFGFVFESGDGDAVLELPGNGRYISIAKVVGRWTGRQNASRDRRFFFDPRFMDAEFEVSNRTERFDVVIGYETIAKEKLIIWSPNAAFTGFRTKPATFDKNEIERAAEKQKKNIQENDARKKALQERKSKLSSSRDDGPNDGLAAATQKA